MTAAGLGALLAVLAWAGWSALGMDDSMTAPHSLASVAPPSDSPSPTVPAASRDVVPAIPAPVAPTADRPAVLPRPDPRALPVAPDGFAMAHGRLTAVRAPSVATVAPIAPMVVTLPAGVRPEDAVVSPTGMVAVMHAGAAPVDAAPEPPRLAAVTHSP